MYEYIEMLRILDYIIIFFCIRCIPKKVKNKKIRKKPSNYSSPKNRYQHLYFTIFHICYIQ